MDPAAEQTHNRKQRARIHNDEMYYISSKSPESALEWSVNKDAYCYETDETNETEFLNEEEDIYDDYYFESYNNMQDESSTMASSRMDQMRLDEVDEVSQILICSIFFLYLRTNGFYSLYYMYILLGTKY